MNWIKGIFAGLLILAGLIGLSYTFGLIGVHQASTIGKARQNVDRVVFEESQSYVEGKRQEALKFYREYQKSDDETAKSAIKEMVAHSFAQFDEGKLDGKVEAFVYNCKYNP